MLRGFKAAIPMNRIDAPDGRSGRLKAGSERRAAPTFDVLVEIQDRWVLAVHHDVAVAVDGMLRGRPLPPEVRSLDESGEVRVEVSAPPPPPPSARSGETGYRRQAALPSVSSLPESELPYSPTPPHIPGTPLQPVRIYAYGVARNRLRQASRRLRVPATLVDQPSEADVIVTATGFNLNVLGDIAFTVDGVPVNFADTVTYRGMMFTGVPNLLWVFGYFRASWTLRADLLGDFVCRLLHHMDEIGAKKVTPRLRPEDADMELGSWIDPDNFNPGYLMRSQHLMPKRGDKPEWQHTQDYWTEKTELPALDLDDGCLIYD